MMRSTRGLGAVGAVALAATLAACGSSGYSGSSSPSAASSGMATSVAAGGTVGKTTLSVAKTSLGSVVAGPDGRTVYQYDKDTKGSGKSSCAGPCLAAWPPVTTTSTPKTPGISGKVGTITTADGKKQVTLDGWPLYYYTGDGGAGDVNGQGIQGIWWVLTSNGAKVTQFPGKASSTGSGGKAGYSY